MENLKFNPRRVAGSKTLPLPCPTTTLFLLSLIWLALALIPNSIRAEDLDGKQKAILHLAFLAGDQVGWPETIQAISMRETKSGSYRWTKYGIVGDIGQGEFGERSYGIMQVKLSTARDVLKKYPHLGSFPTDEHLLVALLTDHVFNITVAAHYFKMLYERFGSWELALIGYNAGPSNAEIGRDPGNYVAEIRKIVYSLRSGFLLGDRTAQKDSCSLKQS